MLSQADLIQFAVVLSVFQDQKFGLSNHPLSFPTPQFLRLIDGLFLTSFSLIAPDGQDRFSIASTKSLAACFPSTSVLIRSIVHLCFW